MSEVYMFLSTGATRTDRELLRQAGARRAERNREERLEVMAKALSG